MLLESIEDESDGLIASASAPDREIAARVDNRR